MTEERDDVVVLVDEDGEEVEFEHLDTIEMNGSEYVVLAPVEQDDEEREEEEVIILKIEHNANGEDSFVTVEDDEMDEVFEQFRLRMEEEFEVEKE